MKRNVDRFGDQAETFDRRAGLNPAVGRTIALAIQNRFSLSAGDVLLEIGAGTGAIGRHLATLPVHYVGVDLSRSMLVVFQRNRLEASGQVLLVQADGNCPWPAGRHSLSLVFASRVVHLLDATHLVNELERTCRPGGYLIIGRVTRQPNSLKSRLRQRKRAMLADHGLHLPDGTAKSQELIMRCVERGAASIEPTTIAQWTGQATACEVISGWADRAGTGGLQVPSELREAIQRELRLWAGHEFGSLHRSEPFTEGYAIGGVRLP